jgi:hypothetical protein
MEGTCLRLADAVFIEPMLGRLVRETLRLERARIPVLHTGVDKRHFYPQPGGRRRGRRSCSWDGSRNKGVVAIAACGLRAGEGSFRLRLHVIGRGEEAVVRKCRNSPNQARRTCSNWLGSPARTTRRIIRRPRLRALRFTKVMGRVISKDGVRLARDRLPGRRRS